MNALTIFFPGVWIHEGAHALACILGGVKVHQINVHSSSGVVVHDSTNARNAWMIAFAPLVIGTGIGIIAIRASQNAWETQMGLAIILGWIGISSAFHSIPSTTDAFNIPRAIWQRMGETLGSENALTWKLAKMIGYLITLPLAGVAAAIIGLANLTILFRLAWVGGVFLVA